MRLRHLCLVVVSFAIVAGSGHSASAELWERWRDRTSPGIRGLAFDRRGERLAAGSMAATDDADTHEAQSIGDIRVWSAPTGTLLRRFGGRHEGVTSLAFTLDGRRLVSGAGYVEKVAILWDTESGTVVRWFEGHRNGVNAVAVSPDGATVLTD